MKRQKENPTEEENDSSEEENDLEAAEAVSQNEDLLEMILLRMPAKTLVRSKCVSKNWLELISNPRFGYKHTARSPKSISALYYHLGEFTHDKLKSVSLRGQRSLPTLSFLNAIEVRGHLTVLHARNGLMLCQYWGPERYIICNITTQKYFLLDQHTENEGYVNLSSLAYDPSVSPYYKVILVKYRCSGSYPIDIYSSETSSWKRVIAPGPAGICSTWCPNLSAFCNGAIHWMTDNGCYFRFEVDTEKLTGGPMPSQPRFKVRFFGNCGGNLLLIQYSSAYVVGLRILQMEPETCRWVLKQRISFRPIEDAFPNDRIRFNLLTVLKGYYSNDFIPVLAIEGKVIAYYPWSETYKVISYTSPDEFLRNYYLQKGGAYQHFENLSPV